MVNGTSMLASASSFLISTARSAIGAVSGDKGVPGEDEDRLGFAQLLEAQAAQASGISSGAEAPHAPAEASTPVDAHGAGGLEQPANAVEAAIPGGKDLPVGLPDAADQNARPEAAVALPGGLPTLPASQSSAAVPDRPARSGARVRPAGTAIQRASAPSANTASGGTGAPHRAQSETRPTAGVSITVAGQRPLAIDSGERAGAETPAPARPRPVRVVDLARGEAPSPTTSASAPSAAPVDQPASTPGTTVAVAPAPTPVAADIDAALDRLMAAREALLPAEAALAIDHAEFGEVSIRFEQAADGRLSAELGGADPELQRAVAAAVASDRGSAAGSEGDGGRPTNFAQQRGSAAGGETTTDGRGTSGDDRELPERRPAGRTPPRQSDTDSGPGVFA